MDQQIKVQAQDGKHIYGLFNESSAGRSDRLVVMAHGLTGRPHEFVNVTAMTAFTRAGYDVARIAFYSGFENARTLRECSIAQHADDLNTLIDHLKPNYDKVYATGHSYGGISLLTANPKDLHAASFWDSTFTPGWQNDVKPVPELDAFAYNNGQESLIGRAMYDEAAHLAANPPYDLAAQFRAPAQVALAKNNEKTGRNRAELFDALKVRKELVMISGANHTFTTGNSSRQLIQQTLRWFSTAQP
jgi:pimeloyl-ACP methyl ester carboxylesterase